jgi:DNA-binding IclR family transcriptional regulator
MAARTADRKYIPGPGIHVLSAMSLGASGLLPRALNDLQALGDTGYIVALGVVWRDEMTYLYHGGPGISPGDAMARGAHFPAARSALGQVLLAKLDAETLDRHVPAEQRPNGPAAFAERLAAIRAAGYARAPQAPGIISLAVPVGEPAYAALGLAGAIPEPDQAELIARLHSVAAHISQS